MTERRIAMKYGGHPKVGIYSGKYDILSTGWFQTLTSLRVPVATVTAAELESSDLDDYPLIIFPGGQKVSVNSRVTAKIKRYVKTDGSLLGVCAGLQYLAETAHLLDVELIYQHQMSGLFLIRVVSRHPIVKHYSVAPKNRFGGPEGIIAVPRGGGWYQVPGPRIKVVAAYDMEGRLAAITEQPCGKGLVVGMGPHPEHSLLPVWKINPETTFQRISWDPYFTGSILLCANLINYLTHSVFPELTSLIKNNHKEWTRHLLAGEVKPWPFIPPEMDHQPKKK